MRTPGQLPPLDDSGKQSSERLLNSETCRKTNSHNSAEAHLVEGRDRACYRITM
jgi:hypothetical protein